MSSNVAISVEGLGKKYRLGSSGSYGRLTESLSSIPRRLAGRHAYASSDFWALRQVTFDVPAGEIVGVIGANGAGKSTLLKLLSRTTRPTEGRAALRGRVGSLLEVGTGFHPELTGRENIHLSGVILGMRRDEITRRFDEIVEFSGVGRFLDTPVKRYSSGMQVRLGFAVAAYLEAEILLIDEVLAVGDVDFQRRCLNRMQDVSSSGRTVLLVSHNTAAVSRLCQNTLLLNSGAIAFYGPTHQALQAYLNDGLPAGIWSPPDGAQSGSSDFGFLEASLNLENGSPAHRVSATEPMTLRISYQVARELTGLMVGFVLHDYQETIVLESYEFDTNGPESLSRAPGNYRSSCVIPARLLNTGVYRLSLVAFLHNVRYLSVERHALEVEVWETGMPEAEFSMNRSGVIAPVLRWSTE